MFIIAVIYIFGWLFACMAGGMMIPLGVAIVMGETAQIQAFLASFIGVLFIGGAIILALKRDYKDSHRKEGLLLLVTIWFVLPLIAAFPFYLSNIPETFLAAYFEAVSGFTTTGATIFVDVSELPKSILIWRALLQWMGGGTTLLILAVILAPVVVADDMDGGFRQLKHASGRGKHQIFHALPMILPIYLGMTIACFFLLVMSRIPVFDAFCLSLSTVSTGGFMPRSGGIALYGSPMAELILAIFMFLGAVSVIWTYSIMQGRASIVREFREPIWIATSIFIVGLLIALMLIVQVPEKNITAFYQSLTLGFLTASSYISTTGFQVSNQTKELIPFTMLVVICIIGGGRLSTAGGLKFFRIALMFKQSARELMQLLFPHGVRPASFNTNTMDTAIMRSVWANFAIILMVIFILTLIVAASGLPLSASFMASISSVSNIGAAYNVANLPELTIAQSYKAMHWWAHAALCFGMILGRIEVLALLSILNISFWRS